MAAVSREHAQAQILNLSIAERYTESDGSEGYSAGIKHEVTQDGLILARLVLLEHDDEGHPGAARFCDFRQSCRQAADVIAGG